MAASELRKWGRNMATKLVEFGDEKKGSESSDVGSSGEDEETTANG